MNTIESKREWWNHLSPKWKQVFSEVVLEQTGVLTLPSDNQLEGILNLAVLRIVGPRGAHPNINFELEDLSGVAELKQLEILIVTYHNIKQVDELANLTRMKSLFLHDNQIQSLEGIERMRNLEELYIHNNSIQSIIPIQNIHSLKKVVCHSNKIENLDGINEGHTENLKEFFVMPNERLHLKAIIPFENKLFIRCR